MTEADARRTPFQDKALGATIPAVMGPRFAKALGRACDVVALEPELQAGWVRVRAAHPAIAVTLDDWLVFVAERITEGDPAVELSRRNLEDLYLVCACDRGDAAGLAALEQHIIPVVERALHGFTDRKELLQMVRERMLVETRSGQRGIAGYDGRAPLAMWLRVCATRIGIREAGRERRSAMLEDHQLDELAPGVPDPELAYLKRLYGAQFRTAFTEAVATLAPRDRTLLRLSVIDGLGIDQIAAIYHMHRATAARQLKRVRTALVDSTRERMRVTLQISATELESIMRLIMSMADLTLRQVLARGRSDAQETE